MQYLIFCQELLNDFFTEQRSFRYRLHFLKLYILTLKSSLSSQHHVAAYIPPFPGHLVLCAWMWRPQSGELEKPFVRLTSPFSARRPWGCCDDIAVCLWEEIGLNEMKPYQNHSTPHFYSMHNLLFFFWKSWKMFFISCFTKIAAPGCW